MDLITADAETFYADSYSLSSMTTEAYIRDPRFEEILWSIKWNDAPAFWLLPDRADHFFKNEVDWANTALIHHHAHFDGGILSFHHGITPALYIDTLSMARVIDGPKAGNSLRELCIRHGIGVKGDFVTYAKGKHLADFTPGELGQYGEYCCNDTDRTHDLAHIFLPQLPESELRLIDLNIRMFTQPVLIGDQAKLAEAVRGEKERKVNLLRRIGLLCPACNGTGITVALSDLFDKTMQPGDPRLVCKKCDGQGVDKKTIGGQESFANLLRGVGVEPETKTSPATGEQIYAFAKTDSFMQECLESPDEDVMFLAEARIGVKSAIVETRAQRFLDCARRGVMPVYISHGAAHTLRPGGGDKMNWLNLSGINAKRPEMAALISAVHAAYGYKIVRVDSGQGEARITAWLAGQHDLVDAFRQGRDVYSEHASTVYGRLVDRKNIAADHIPGQVGKVSILGMGYQMAWYKASMELLKGMLGAPPIQFTAKDMDTLQVDPTRFLSNPKNIQRVNEMPSRLELNDRLIHCAVTAAVVERYRAKYQMLPAYWRLMESVINAMIRGEEMVFGAHGILRTGHECIHLPNGMKLNYRGIARSDDGEASYFNGRSRTHIYGGLVTENVTQCLHRLIVCEQMLEISTVLKVALMRYDDVVCVVPEGEAEMAKQFMVQTMSTTPAVYVGLPLLGEGKVGNSLVEVK